MAQKKKRQTTRKTKEQIAKSVERQRESAYHRLSGEIEDLMFDVATIADGLLDLLPRFKRLKLKDRKLIYDHMNFVLQGLEDAVDDYYDTLPESGEEPSVDDLRGLGALVGIAAALGAIGSRPPQDPPSDEQTEWPDSLDVEFRKVEREPKMLKGGE